MSWVAANIRWIMLVAGALTCTMVYAAIAPQAALRSTFGEALEGPLAEIVVRSWGVLITLIGAMLVYGAYHPPVRPLVLTVAATSKVAFIGLVLGHGSRYLGHAGLAIAVDVVLVALFATYLIGLRRREAAA